MIIIDSTPNQKTLSLPTISKPLIYLSLLVLITAITTPALIAISKNSTPTGTYLNPLPTTELTQALPTPTPSYTPEQLIISAQAYLEKAIFLSQKQPQTDTDKQQIITYLNSSLEYANQAVTTAPNAPESYLVRARVLASSTSVRPDATQLAQKDLETAQLLSGGQPVSLPTEVNLINYTPTQQAGLASNLIIAAPEENNTATSSAETVSNITKRIITIPAGETTITLTNHAITSDSYIYLIPTTGNQTAFVQTKTAGEATIAITQPASQDLALEYWIVNP